MTGRATVTNSASSRPGTEWRRSRVVGRPRDGAVATPLRRWSSRGAGVAQTGLGEPDDVVVLVLVPVTCPPACGRVSLTRLRPPYAGLPGASSHPRGLVHPPLVRRAAARMVCRGWAFGAVGGLRFALTARRASRSVSAPMNEIRVWLSRAAVRAALPPVGYGTLAARTGLLR
jgi:hypothetical protein